MITIREEFEDRSELLAADGPLELDSRSADHLVCVDRCDNDIREADRNGYPIHLIGVQKSEAREEKMTDHDVSYFVLVSSLNAVEEDYAPECVKKDNAQSQSGARDEEHVRAALQSHCSGTDCVSEDVYTLKQLEQRKKVNELRRHQNIAYQLTPDMRPKPSPAT